MVRASLHARAASASIHPTPSKSHPALPPVQPTKKSKRTARHAVLLTRIATSAITKSSKKNLKRKESRASKQNLITGLSSLADALPDADNEDGWEDWEHDVFDQSSKDALRNLQHKRKAGGEGKMKMKTIKSKPGAQKRKEKVLREECVRFGKNLAIMNSATVAAVAEGRKSGAVQVPAVNSWAALRGFIANTMERKEEFVQMEAGQSGAGSGMDVDV
ncbi:ribosome biogenesis protein SLX9-domain-containing protein [Tirmania nivea]|nr:ribosome biogenesis protein SLX9-domain-containing protein [Tirmania nivea]